MSKSSDYYALCREPGATAYLREWWGGWGTPQQDRLSLVGTLATHAIEEGRLAISRNRPFSHRPHDELVAFCCLLGPLTKTGPRGAFPKRRGHNVRWDDVLIWEKISLEDATLLSIFCGLKYKTLRECPKCVLENPPERSFARIFAVNPKKRQRRLCDAHRNERRVGVTKLPPKYSAIAKIFRNHLDYRVLRKKDLTSGTRQAEWHRFKQAAERGISLPALRRQFGIPKDPRRGRPRISSTMRKGA